MSLLLPSAPSIHRFTGTLIRPEDDGHRDAAWGIQVLAQWLEPERDTANRHWVRALTDALTSWARPACFPNFIADSGVTIAYGAERHARLVEAKDRWDPSNVFRLNHNIRATG